MTTTIAAFVSALFSLWLSSARAHAHEASDEKLPPPPVRMRVVAPSAKGPWLLRIDNESDAPVRIAADVRLLRFEVRVPSDKPVRQTYGHGWTKRATVCDGTQDFFMSEFPADRELVLEPGHSYIEEFDPRLICFGKNADLLVPGAMVKPSMGWKPKPAWSRRMAAAPFVVDDAHEPRRYRPLRRIDGPEMLLSHAPPVVYGSTTEGRSDAAPTAPEPPPASAAPAASNAPSAEPASKGAAGEDIEPARATPGAEAPKPAPKTAEQASRHRPRPQAPRRPPPPKDELSARMTLTASRYADAVRPSEVQLSVQAHNSGERPLFVALRSRMLSFDVEGPNGRVRCRLSNAQHQVPRDLFKTLHHGKHIHMDVLLAEMCPPGTFDRPGLYVATPTLIADANGQQYGLQALTGIVTTRDPGDPSGTHQRGDDATLIRIRKGRARFYRDRPMQMPTRVLPQ